MVVLGNNALEFPTEAACLILVGCFDHKKHGADCEKGASDERGDAPSSAGFVRELGLGVGYGKPVEETADDKDCTADGEEEGHQEGDVPVGKRGEHAGDTFKDGL